MDVAPDAAADAGIARLCRGGGAEHVVVLLEVRWSIIDRFAFFAPWNLERANS